MADGKFDSSNQAHVSELALRLGHTKVVWTAEEGPGQCDTVLRCVIGDRELCYATPNKRSPVYRPEGRAFALGLLARKVCAELLGEVARDAKVEAYGT